MALQKTVTTNNGFDAPDAYHRVEGIEFINKTTMRFRIRSHKATGLSPFADEGAECAYDVNGENPFAQAYAHLKTLTEFTGASDV
jgi:hypothetical protein